MQKLTDEDRMSSPLGSQALAHYATALKFDYAYFLKLSCYEFCV